MIYFPYFYNYYELVTYKPLKIYKTTQSNHLLKKYE